MEGIPIYYVMQPSVDDSLNVFFLPSNLKSQSDVKIQDVVNNFPHRNNGKFYHFRFYALCDKDQKTWVDISNLQAKAPVVDNRILVKILELAQPHYTKIFASVYGAKSSVPNGQSALQQSQPQTQRPTQSDNRPRPQAQSQPQTQQQQQVRSPPHTTSQRPAANNQNTTPTTKSQAAHEFDLLGGGDDVMGFSATTTTTTTRTNVTFSSPPQSQASKSDNSHLQGMSREQIGVFKQQQMDQAIQDKLDFAKKVWQDEEKTNNDKTQAYNEVEDLIRKWSGKDNQRNNIRALLCTLQDVVWAESGWVSLSFSDLMQPAQIKKNYFKAITRFHPDKNQAADYKQRYIAERVTNELNAAWDEFRKTNP